MTAIQTFPIGTLAYFDTISSGLVPVKIIGRSGVDGDLHYKVTATRGAYKRGMVGKSSELWLPPRSMVRVSGGQYRIRTRYRYE